MTNGSEQGIDEAKLREAFKLVKEDIGDLYNKIEELSDKVEEMRVTEVTLADKIVKKADKKLTSNVRKTKKKR